MIYRVKIGRPTRKGGMDVIIDKVFESGMNQYEMVNHFTGKYDNLSVVVDTVSKVEQIEKPVQPVSTTVRSMKIDVIFTKEEESAVVKCISLRNEANDIENSIRSSVESRYSKIVNLLGYINRRCAENLCSTSSGPTVTLIFYNEITEIPQSFFNGAES